MMSLCILAGCAVRSDIPPDQIWPDDRYMTRLERDVVEFCVGLMKDVRPDRVHLVWYDNVRPHSPMLSEAYVVSMFERSLIRMGFSVSASQEDAAYRLNLAMTPSRSSLLALASLVHGNTVIATKEAHFINGPEKWSRVLCTHRYRAKSIIALRGEP